MLEKRLERNIIDIAREITAISQSGLNFSKDPFDQERFHQLIEIASALVHRHTSHPMEYIAKVFSADKGYVTPKLDTRGAVFQDSKILMVKEQDSGTWTLPGGFIDINESLSEATAREVREESGFEVLPKKVAAIYDHRKHGYKPHLYHFYKMYMLCDLAGGCSATSRETTEVRFFSRDELRQLPLDLGRVTVNHVLRMFDHLSNPSMPTDFD